MTTDIERELCQICAEKNHLDFLTRRVGELDHRVRELEDEIEMMNRDQLSLIFLCSVATTLCMTLSIAMLVI